MALLLRIVFLLIVISKLQSGLPTSPGSHSKTAPKSYTWLDAPVALGMPYSCHFIVKRLFAYFRASRGKSDVSEGKTNRAARTSSNITLQFGSGVECAVLPYEDFSRSKNQNARKNDDDLEKQTDPRNSHRSSHVLPLPCPSPRRLIAGSTGGPVSHDGWSLGYFRFALCETEITGEAGCEARSSLMVTDSISRTFLMRADYLVENLYTVVD